MKRKLFSVALLACSVAIVSCQKQDTTVKPKPSEGMTFTASVEEIGTKAILDGKAVKWSGNDSISINGVIFKGTPRQSDSTQADFVKDDAKGDPTSPFYAFFPAGIQSGTNFDEGTLPAVQTYREGRFDHIPMYAVSENSTLSFKNICGVLAVTIKSDEMSAVKKIRVSSSNRAMSGAFKISDDGTKAELKDSLTSSVVVVLDCGTGIAPVSEGTTFHIAIPALTYRNLKIELSSDGTEYTRSMVTKNADIIVAANKIYPVSFQPGITGDTGSGIVNGGNASAGSVTSAD